MYVISIKFVRAIGVNFHTLPNKNNAQIGSNLISHVFTLNTAFPGHEFICRKTLLKREIWPPCLRTTFVVLQLGWANVYVCASSLAQVNMYQLLKLFGIALLCYRKPFKRKTMLSSLVFWLQFFSVYILMRN